MNKIKECKNFLLDNKVTFNELIRCANFWSDLTSDERGQLIDAYTKGQFDDVGGWY